MPTKIGDLINWCTVHVDLWSVNATSVGLTAAQALQFKNAVNTMVLANSSAEAARQASKDATITLQTNVDVVRTLGAAFVAVIKGYAETTNNNNVYALGGVSPSDPPGVVPTPVAPNQFGASINPDGSLTVKWKVTQPAGCTNVSYSVSRRLNGGTGPFVLLANEGGRNKSFVDTTLPIGVDKVEYIVQPRRGDVAGPQSTVFMVQFGSVAGGGGMSITSTETGPIDLGASMKMAA
ncbi:MAG TPA: hypothetical protein PKE29_08545 [Phycisphaerales bacterium]|nr:hypothetical protein [Phycisphaerales bacterium]